MGKKKVYVGLSGGVDSSVSAALLQKAGFDVFGVFIKVWQPDIAITGGCTWREDRLDAMRVCSKLNIPFYMLDLEKEYKKEVVDYMINEYKVGRTPNPDVMCNKYIKFGGFFDWAIKQGADYVATGHYAQARKNRSGKFELLAGKDKNKDQSYFLWTLTQKQLAKTLFPVGNIEKPQVRIMAKKFNLLTAEKKDSQGICFIGKVEMTDFLKKFIKPKRGKVINEEGVKIGTHDGVYYYTIGQRHGFNINVKSNTDEPYFIIDKNLKQNTLTVSHNPISYNDSISQEVKITNLNWVMNSEPNLGKKYQARIRYRQPLEACQLEKISRSKFLIKFVNPQKAPTPGQSVVIYDKEVCVGGGIIE